MKDIMKQMKEYLKTQVKSTAIGLVLLVIVYGIKYVIIDTCKNKVFKNKSKYIDVDGDE